MLHGRDFSFQHRANYNPLHNDFIIKIIDMVPKTLHNSSTHDKHCNNVNNAEDKQLACFKLQQKPHTIVNKPFIFQILYSPTGDISVTV